MDFLRKKKKKLLSGKKYYKIKGKFYKGIILKIDAVLAPLLAVDAETMRERDSGEASLLSLQQSSEPKAF